MAIPNTMARQVLRPKQLTPANTTWIKTMGLGYVAGTRVDRGRNWFREQTSWHPHFCLHVSESYYAGDALEYTRQEDYIKANFWLGGKHTTVMDGYGQHQHDRPEVVLTSGPCDMLKIDAMSGETQVTSVSVCFLPDFFPVHLGLDTNALPAPLRSMASGGTRPFGFHRAPLSAHLSTAARAILTAPLAVRQDPAYGKAKAIELMCLLLNQLSPAPAATASLACRAEARLLQAREILTRHLADAISLETLAREVGLNRTALTSGFHRLFGLSVYDYQHRARMNRAHVLLQDHERPIGEIAEAVGYSHPCNFSTAFKAYFGYAPSSARGDSR